MEFELLPQQVRLIQAAFAPQKEAVAAWHEWSANVHIDNADAFAFDLLPAIYRNLADSAAADVPRLKGIYKRTLVQNNVWLNSRQDALRRVAEAAPATIVIGDVGVLSLADPRLGAFTLKRLALLIPPDSVQRAWQSLIDGGWQASKMLYPTNVAHVTRYHHHIQFVNPVLDGRIELFWRLLPELTSAPLFASAKPTHCVGIPLHTLTPEHQLLASAWPSHTSDRLRRALLGMILIKDQAINWDIVLDAAQEMRWQLPLRDLFSAMEQLMPQFVPPGVNRRLTQQRVRYWQRIEYRRPLPSGRFADKLRGVYVGYRRSVSAETDRSRQRLRLAHYIRQRWRPLVTPQLEMAPSSSSRKQIVGPDAVCIGPAKTGTSWLYVTLGHHSEIYTVPIKEINYYVDARFTENGQPHYLDSPFKVLFGKQIRYQSVRKNLWQYGISGLSLTRRGRQARSTFMHLLRYFLGQPGKRAYQGLFAAKNSAVACDISPLYYESSTDTAARLHSDFPDTKLLVMVRNPIDRMWSHVKMLYRDDPESSGAWRDAELDKEEQLLQLAQRICLGWTPYERVLTRWRQFFPDLHVAYHDELLNNPVAFLNQICLYLEIEPDRIPPSVVKNRVNVGHSEPMPQPVRDYLNRFFRPEIERMANGEHKVYAQRWLAQLDQELDEAF